jgi:ABC-2 type transport system ATP-binding protein
MSLPLEVQSLAVRYGRHTVLDGITFAVKPGQVYALLGRNGEGKTSLLRCALGWQPAQGGAARLFGASAWDTRRDAMARVGVVEEHPTFPLHLKVGELLAFVRTLRATWKEAETSARLDRAGISPKSAVATLSRGQRAQLSMALALAHGPELLLLDDPTLGLDAVARRTFFETLVTEMADGALSVLLTTHDLPGVEGVADRVGILQGGRLVVEEELESLKARLRRLRWPAGQPTPAIQALDPLRIQEGALGGEALVAGFQEPSFEALCQAAPGLTAEALALEDAFIALVDARKEVRA